MSKKKLIIIVVTIFIMAIIAIGASFLKYKITEKNRNYEIEKIDKYNYFILKTNNDYGVIDTKGNIVIDKEYEKIIIPNPTKDVFVCYKNGETIILNSNKEQILTEYENVEPIKLKNIASDLTYEKSVLRYKKDNKYGIIDFTGKVLTKAIYENIDSISYKEGELLVKKDGKYGVINIKGHIMVKPGYDEIISDDYYNEETGYKLAGYIVGIKSQEGFKYGYINNKGTLELDIEYNEINRVIDIHDNNTTYLIARKNGQYGLLKNGKEILQYEYQSIEYDNTANIFVLEKTRKYGVANLDGKVIIPIENTELEIKGMYIYTKKDENKYVYNKNGESLDINFNKSIVSTNNSNYKITVNIINDKSIYGIIDSNNNQLVEEKYLYIEYAYNNYFIACGEDGKLGVIDDKGNIVVDLKHDIVQRLKDKNIIQIVDLQNNTTQIYSSNLEKVIELSNVNIQSEDEYIKVYSNSELKYLDNNGNVINNTEILNNKLFAKKENDKWGFINKDGEEKLNFEYQKVTDFNKYGYASIKKDDKWGSINEDGGIIIEPTYKFPSNTEPDFIGKYYKVQYEFGEIYYTDLINE